MKKILFQSDDYGITRGVSEGILYSIQEGIIRNTGLFVNMEYSKWAAEKIKNLDVCLGIDINYVAGMPVSNSIDIPHLVKENGHFYSSSEQNKRNNLIKLDGLVSYYEKDPYPYKEILLETENQVKKFIELIGRKPDYIHPHSLMTPNCVKAQIEVAKKYNIYSTLDLLNGNVCKELPGAIMNIKGMNLENQLNAPIEKNLIENAIPSLQDEETGYYIFHCGYVDAELFKHSSLTLRRAIDLEAATSKKIIEYINENNIKLITYKDYI